MGNLSIVASSDASEEINALGAMGSLLKQIMHVFHAEEHDFGETGFDLLQ
jgi:hypothetical protein